jgi:hypothetical protein
MSRSTRPQSSQALGIAHAWAGDGRLVVSESARWMPTREGGLSMEVERSEDLVSRAEDIEQDVAPGREPGVEEPPTEESAND